MVVDTKPWYLSKQVWVGVVMTIIGVATYFSTPENTPVLTISSVSLAVGGVAQIILRVWFTAQPITEFALRNYQKLLQKRLPH